MRTDIPMEPTINALKRKLAWQVAWRLRSCPGDDMLFSEQPIAEVKRHLTICPACSRATASVSTRNSWRALAGKLCVDSVHKATGTKPVEGQVWSLKDDLCHWREDGNYYWPPRVLLLGIDDNALKVAQTYHDTSLADDGDVVLSDSRFGFAQAWNIYTIHKDMLDYCLGGVKQDEVQSVLSESEKLRVDIDENSILYWFRTTEVAVGAEIAMPAVVQLMAEKEVCLTENEAFLQKIFGTLAEVYEKLSKFKLPEYTESLVELLSDARDPQGITPVVAATSIPLQVNVVIKHQDGAITIKTVGATLTENNWEDNDYYVAGKLNETQQEDLFLVASLNMNGNVVCECQSCIENGSPFFDILFKSVAKEASTIENLKFILVKP